MSNRDSAIQSINYLLTYHPHGLRDGGSSILFCLDDKPNVPKREWSNYLHSITNLFTLAAQGKPAGEALSLNVDRRGRIVFISFPSTWVPELDRIQKAAAHAAAKR